MKVKRFLLRYDPPGVGLEVEDGGELRVQHKDLPSSEKISSAKDIKSVVEQLLASEPELLTRRRHWSALIALLCRLYHVENDSADQDGADESNDAGDDGFLEGQTVVLTGLQAEMQVLNGEIGKVVKARGDKQKYEIEMKDEIVKIKGTQHLLHVSAKRTVSVSDYVVIRGLRNHIELNGCQARVQECHEEAQRYEVRSSESGQLFRVKRDNIVLIEGQGVMTTPAVKENREPNANATPRKKEGGLPPAAGDGQPTGEGGGDAVFEVGSTVELMGLKTAQAYNGQQAEVLSVDRVRGRYEIRLGDGSVKTIRAENVRLVSGKSPRSKRPKDKST
eukprot:TRINITY_DN11025_c0_g1_i1.p1 TRINITY_DN11025_c0_g1~~TRINITY_DN11025_c0_g1_i1.p1  ORF type:complete len:334 (+),score=78.88 TRINITY_DN11025_c0_g1_i1:158-1159(+)